MEQKPVFFKTIYSLSFGLIFFITVILAASFVSADNGALVWTYRPGSPRTEIVETGIGIGHDGTIYVGTSDFRDGINHNYLHAINPDGNFRWEFELEYPIRITPAIGSDGTIYALSYHCLYAFQPDGSLEWKYKMESVYTPVSGPAAGDDGTVYFLSQDNYVYSVNPGGSLNWRYMLGGESAPALGSDGTIYIGSDDNHLHAINPDGKLKWKYYTDEGYVGKSSPVIGGDGTIYFSNTDLHAVNPDGSMKWRLPGINSSDAPSIGPDGTIYSGSGDEKLFAITPDGSLLWEYPDARYSPVIGSDGTIYASLDFELQALNPDGSLAWKYEELSAIIGNPGIGTDGMIYVGTPFMIHAITAEGFTCAEDEPGDISINPSSKDFGDIFLDYPVPKRFYITNAGIGCDGLSILSVDITGENNSDFILKNNRCVENLQAKHICTFDVIFSPLSKGEKNADILISSDDPDTPVLNVPLAGNAHDPADFKDFACKSPGTDTLLVPTIVSARDGDWNDPATWDKGRTPLKTDVVLVQNHKITNLPPVTRIKTLCNYGELISMPDSSMEIQAPGGISNYTIGVIRGQDGRKDATPGDCGNAGKDVILNTGTYVKKEGKAGDWWWSADNAGPIYNDGKISGGDGEDMLVCGGKGGDALVLGRNVTNDTRGVIKSGKGGDGSRGKGGRGGLTQIFGKMGGPGDLISRGSVTAGNGGDGLDSGGSGGNLWFVSLPNVYLGLARESYVDTPIQSTHHAGSGGSPGGDDGWIRIEPNLISIGAGTRIRGGDITIFGGNDWTLDLSEAEESVIEANGDLTVSVGNNGTIDLTDNKENLLKASGRVSIFADNVQLDPGIVLTDIIQASEIETGPGKILRDITLTGAGQASGKAGTVIPVRVTLANGGPEADTCMLNIANSEGEPLASPIEVEVEGLESAGLELDVTVPSTFGDTEELTITAVSLADPDTVAETKVRISVKPDAYIDENSPHGTLAGTAISTNLTGPVNYSVTAGNTGNVFAINSSTGEITVNEGSLPDFETNAVYSLTVRASDGENSEMTKFLVSINNLNDNSPELDDQVFTIDENSENGTVIGTISASDEDNDPLTYAFTNDNTNNAFAVSSAGKIIVNDSSQLNYEKKAAHTLTVQVSDGVNITAADIPVKISDVNDRPVINDQNLYFGNTSVNGTVIGTIKVTDEDNGPLVYAVTESNTDNAFKISSTGDILINDDSQLDYKASSAYEFTVRISDDMYAETATVKVGFNNIPTVNGSTLSVDENVAGGTEIYQVEAEDADNDKLAYSITGGNTDNVFAIDADTGQIITVKHLDYEDTASYIFTIEASDGKQTGAASIAVNLNNLNDNPPLINDRTFTIDENSPKGSVVGISEASDADGYIHTYRIKEGNEKGAFAINPVSGEITVDNSYELDYEDQGSYELTVRVFDGDHSETATVTVNLNNLNDNPPVLNDQVFFINENIGNRIFGMAGASDPDNDPLTYSITGGNMNIFAINANTGYISVCDSRKLDYPEYTLTVQASDGVHVDTAAITVNIDKVIITGDFDGSGTVDLQDAVKVLKIMTNTESGDIYPGADVNSDKKTGLEDLIYILREISS